MSARGDRCFKIVVVGASGVGKTAIVNQLVNKEFTEGGPPTIGVEFKSYSLKVDDECVRFQS
jgi:Ras-related protein Rab-7A